jgi:glutaminyl-peptide cyclotransferase
MTRFTLLSLAVVLVLTVAVVAVRPTPAVDQPKFAEGTGATQPVDNKPKFAEGTAGALAFDAERAKKYLADLCDLGPRVSDSEPMRKQIEVLTAHFEKHGAKVSKQTFQARQNSKRENNTFTNLIASWNPERARRIILCAHYDTRPMAHEEPDRKSWNRPFHSANDGTSGVAMLMELAHYLKDAKTPVGVDVVFFDAEEFIFEPMGAFGGGDRFFIGSEYFAAEYRRSAGARKFTYEGAILFDLFAHKDAVLRVEGQSFLLAPRLSYNFFKTAAAKAGSKHVKYEQGGDVRDDHLALNAVGIPAIDIIDLDGYREHWHKLSDTPDKVSGETMKDVAGVVWVWLQSL